MRIPKISIDGIELTEQQARVICIALEWMHTDIENPDQNLPSERRAYERALQADIVSIRKIVGVDFLC